MAVPVYSSRLIAISGFTGGPAVAYTVPAGYVAAVKCIAASVGANTPPVGWRLIGVGGAQLARWDLDTVVTAGGTQLLEGHWVLYETETLSLETTGGLVADFYVSGYLLTLP